MMIRRFAAALSVILLALTGITAMAAPAHGGHKAAPATAPIPLADTVRVALVTTLGTIEIDLDGKRLLAAKVPSLDVGKHLVSLVSEAVHGTRPEVVCLQPKVTRPVVVDLEGKAPVGKKRR